MTAQSCSSYAHLYHVGHYGPHVPVVKSPGGLVDLVEVAGPAGDVSRPALPEIILHQELTGKTHVTGNFGAGRFSVTAPKWDFILAAPNCLIEAIGDTNHRVRSLAFPIAQWQSVLDDAADGRFSFDSSFLYGRVFDSATVRSLVQRMWSLSDDESGPSRLLARAAGCEILAELCRMGGAAFAPSRGGLAPWAQRRCLELMRARLSEDISLDELAAEARLSAFHFARMFKESLGVPPRVYLTQLRIEKACELLEHTDLPITEIALEVGYSSNQVLARVFLKHRHMSPTDYRRAVRDPGRSIAQQ